MCRVIPPAQPSQVQGQGLPCLLLAWGRHLSAHDTGAGEEDSLSAPEEPQQSLGSIGLVNAVVLVSGDFLTCSLLSPRHPSGEPRLG